MRLVKRPLSLRLVDENRHPRTPWSATPQVAGRCGSSAGRQRCHRGKHAVVGIRVDVRTEMDQVAESLNAADHVGHHRCSKRLAETRESTPYEIVCLQWRSVQYAGPPGGDSRNRGEPRGRQERGKGERPRRYRMSDQGGAAGSAVACRSMYSVLPEPGGPIIRRLCAPAAAITSALGRFLAAHVGVVVFVMRMRLKQLLQPGGSGIDFECPRRRRPLRPRTRRE